MTTFKIYSFFGRKSLDFANYAVPVELFCIWAGTTVSE
jgi:hypothetical protein